ncbi:MAG: methyl-accepting chemotaxis protein, partial [Oscillospiraceae bacterium]|nr:methyl-accepting chemotaxis protein [Oscillospiraceae bacterium]
GFAVVAQEVGNLAAKSRSAAHETNELIKDSVEKSNLGTQIANKTAASLKEIVERITESSALSERISELANEQDTVTTEIQNHLNEINSAVALSSNTATESAKGCREVNHQSGLLRESIQMFKIQ